MLSLSAPNIAMNDLPPLLQVCETASLFFFYIRRKYDAKVSVRSHQDLTSIWTGNLKSAPFEY